MEKGLLHKQIRDFFVRNFDVRQEKEDELETIESIRKGIEFKGTNLWVLIFATFVAPGICRAAVHRVRSMLTQAALSACVPD